MKGSAFSVPDVRRAERTGSENCVVSELVESSEATAMPRGTGAHDTRDGLADEFNRPAGSEESSLQVCDQAMWAVREIAVRMSAEVSTHFRIGDSRREAVERAGEESTSRAIEHVARVRSECEQYVKLARWANTLLASLDCVDREQFINKLTQLLRCYEAVGQLCEREDWRISEVVENIHASLARYGQLQRDYKSLQEQLRTLQEKCARQKEEIRWLKARANEQAREAQIDVGVARAVRWQFACTHEGADVDPASTEYFTSWLPDAVGR
ncbi:hypothetical protein Aduo_012196 [Ancylostoma duodenale]